MAKMDFIDVDSAKTLRKGHLSGIMQLGLNETMYLYQRDSEEI